MFKLSCIVYLYVYVILISSIDLITGEIIDYSQQSEGNLLKTVLLLFCYVWKMCWE